MPLKHLLPFYFIVLLNHKLWHFSKHVQADAWSTSIPVEICGKCEAAIRALLPDLVNSPKKRWKDPPCYQWVNPLFQWPFSIATLREITAQSPLGWFSPFGGHLPPRYLLQGGGENEGVCIICRFQEKLGSNNLPNDFLVWMLIKHIHYPPQICWCFHIFIYTIHIHKWSGDGESYCFPNTVEDWCWIYGEAQWASWRCGYCGCCGLPCQHRTSQAARGFVATSKPKASKGGLSLTWHVPEIH